MIDTTARLPKRSARPSARAMVSRLIRACGSSVEAGNLTALAVGLGPVASGWSLLETARLKVVGPDAETGPVSS